MNPAVPIDKDHLSLEERLLRELLKPYLGKIADIKEGFNLLCEIIEVFKADFPRVDKNLNNHFVKILLLVRSSFDEFEHLIENQYYNNSDTLPSDFIHPHIFGEYLYIPFENLYEGTNQILDRKISWEEIAKRMEDNRAKIKVGYSKVFPGKSAKPDHAKLIKSASKYTKQFLPNKMDTPDLTCSSLKLNIINGTIQYKNNAPIKVTIDGREMKFLRLLLQYKGKILRYETVASRLQMNFYHRGVINEDAGEEVRYLKRDLVILLKMAGMKIHEIKKMITIQKNEGYILHCQTS